jgi:PAS domain S-box-containing protein
MDDRTARFGTDTEFFAFVARLPGEMPRLVLEKDWAKTPLGPVEAWPQSLKLAVATVLASGFPLCVRWGEQLVSIYNDAYAPVLGSKHPAALGQTADQVWPEIANELVPLNLAILRGEHPAFFEKNYLWRLHHEGVPQDARFTASYSPIPDANAPNGIGGIFVIALNTTEEYRTDQQLRRITQQLEDEVAQRTRERDRVWELSEDLMAVTDFEGKIHSANPAWKRLLDWSEDELKQMTVEDLRHPDDAPAAKVQRARLASGQPQARMENRFRHKDGSWYWFNWTLAADNGLIYVIGRNINRDGDVTQRVRDSERDFRTLVDAVTDYAIFRLTPDGTVASWNAGAERAKGYLAGEIIGKHVRTFHTPEDQADGVAEQLLKQAAREGRAEAEGWRVRKDGSRFWAHVVIDPIYDENGNLSGFAKITKDITERQEAQLALQRTQEQLSQAQKMDALGQLTGGIAHDFNNMLMVVGGYTQFLKQRLHEPKDKRAIEAIEFAASRAESLTRQLLTFSRRQSLNRTTVKLVECFDAMRDILDTTAKGNVALDIAIPEGTWPVTIDVNEFEVAIINLIVNARDAMPKGGRIKITTHNETIDERRPVAHLRGDFVVLEVEDEGSGIPPDIVPKVFDPFFTTKSVEKGTGLGLSQVYGFVHQAGGTVRLTSKVDVGTKVALYLPRSREATIPVQDEQGTRLIGGNETILLVEDNPDVQSVAAGMLEELGYSVRTADSAARALDVLKSDNIHLVLTDIVLPGTMDGLALGHHITREQPGIKVLLTTGYAQTTTDPRNPFVVLRKPYQLATMARAVRNALDQAGIRPH